MRRASLSVGLLLAAVVATAGGAAPASRHRLPPDHRWGRCLLQVEGRNYISGACAYTLSEKGSFQIEGPHQVYAGIDYPRNSWDRSNDYFAQVDVEGDTAEGFWSADKRSTHAQAHLGTLRRRGACWVNAEAKVCLWRR